jgi:glycosyltransferase involved in cell wall biosynthesis
MQENKIAINPLISIILPVYNGGKYLAISIERCLNQNFTNFELIIVNDCSTDNTLNIAYNYAEKDNRIIIINNEENKKLPASLNIGHREAKGDFVTWTSDDNIMKPNFLESLLNTLEKEEADLVYSDYDIINNDGKLKREHKSGPTEHLIFGNIIGASFLYKKEVFATLKGFDENLYLLEDYDFWLRASLKFKFIHCKENLYQYRLHENSLTAKIQDSILFNEQHKNNFILMFKNYADNLGWRDSTKKILMLRYLKTEDIISDYLIHQKTIKADILKLKNNDLNKELILYGLLLNLRNELMNNKDNYNFRTLVNILKNERLLLFHKLFSKKVTFNYIKNCII